MKKDTWYKRLGWFILFSIITLIIFFLIDLLVHRIMYYRDNNEYVTYFTEEVYYYSLSEQNPIEL